MASGPHSTYPHLFQPFTLNGVTLRNRVAISGHLAGWYIGPGGLPSDELAAYIVERGRGGVGLFVIGSNVPAPGYDWIENTSDAIIPRYRAIADAAHPTGIKVFAQLCHPGFFPLPGPPRVTPPPRATPTIATSRGPVRETPTIAQLHELIAAHGAAARRVRDGGLDGVELHAHEFFLHAQLLSPVWNERDDEYGGSFENRLRFLIETLQAMRTAVGRDYVVGVRLKAADMLDGGMDAEEYCEVLRRLESPNLIDYVNLSGGDAHFHHGPMPRPEGEWIDLIRMHRAATRLAIMHAGRLSNAELAEHALAEGVIDIAVMTKTHIADPHFTRKVFEGRTDDIRFCTRCLQSCHGNLWKMTCVYNPLTGREREWATILPAPAPKRVVVVGAGPAGMEAALTAAQRGHHVTVIERAGRIGGQIWAGAASPLRRPWARIAEFYTRQAAKGAFTVRLGVDATAETVLAESPDAVVIATGSRPLRFELPGGPPALTVYEALAGAADSAAKVVIFDREGFSRPFVVADLLSSRGAEVIFLTALAEVGPLFDGHMRDEMIQQLRARGVTFTAGVAPVGWIGAGMLLVRDTGTAEEQVIDGVDALVATVGSASVDELAGALRGRVPELYVIGDANAPQTVEQATYQGARIGRLL
jgi:2,4-dienoyl-CoA reductase-like NADH-dependent reductase (Old Yellow Enzyme family)/NADPH-dependent 2,4-dienoyl-CoA reductase/sulfur reductase-like enzyme